MLQYPKIMKVIKYICDGEGVDFRIDVSAKKTGPRRWGEVLFSLNSLQLMDIDNLSETNKMVVVESFRKALIREYGKKWPNSLMLALYETASAKDILSPPVGESHQVAGRSDDFAALAELGRFDAVFE